jgi:hypothetical protein
VREKVRWVLAEYVYETIAIENGRSVLLEEYVREAWDENDGECGSCTFGRVVSILSVPTEWSVLLQDVAEQVDIRSKAFERCGGVRAVERYLSRWV